MNRKKIQKYLAQAGFYKGAIDGIFGPKTRAAVEAFQKREGLIVDGIAGPQTQAALKMLIKKPRRPKEEPVKSAMIGATPMGNSAKVPCGFEGKIEIPFTRRRITHICNHCAATPEGKHFDANDINAWHKARGWSGIGYHFVVLLDGTIEFGRPIGQTGAHVKGKNTGSVGIAYVGGVTQDGNRAKDTRTQAQKAAMLWLNQELADMYGVSRISGHNEFAPKACPSFDVKTDAIGNIRGFWKGRREA